MKLWFFLQLIRWKNLVILATTLLILKFCFINIFTEMETLDIFRFFILLMSIVLISAAGYIINDIQDIETDLINKPDKVFVGTVFTMKQSYSWYLILNFLGVLLGFYIANYLQKPIFSSVFIIVSFLLYYYSITLKKWPLIGNIVIGLLVSLSILTLAFFDLILNAKTDDLGFHYLLFELIFEFSIFAFMLNFIREIVKDIEDVPGDKLMQMKTLPILIGLKYSKLIIGFLTLILIIALTYFIISYLPFHTILFYYFIIFITLPLLYFEFKLYHSAAKSDFDYLSKILKFCMLTGIISILLISLTLKNVF